MTSLMVVILLIIHVSVVIVISSAIIRHPGTQWADVVGVAVAHINRALGAVHVVRTLAALRSVSTSAVCARGALRTRGPRLALACVCNATTRRATTSSFLQVLCEADPSISSASPTTFLLISLSPHATCYLLPHAYAVAVGGIEVNLLSISC